MVSRASYNQWSTRSISRAVLLSTSWCTMFPSTQCCSMDQWRTYQSTIRGLSQTVVWWGQSPQYTTSTGQTQGFHWGNPFSRHGSLVSFPLLADGGTATSRQQGYSNESWRTAMLPQTQTWSQWPTTKGDGDFAHRWMHSCGCYPMLWTLSWPRSLLGTNMEARRWDSTLEQLWHCGSPIIQCSCGETRYQNSWWDQPISLLWGERTACSSTHKICYY